MKKLYYNKNVYNEKNGFIKKVPNDIEKFINDKIKTIRKHFMAQIDDFYYPEINPEYKIEVMSNFDMVQIFLDNLYHSK